MWLRKETGMAKRTHEEGETQGEERDHGPGADPATADEIEATGDAIIISAAIHDLADSFREFAAAVRAMIPSSQEDDGEEPKTGRYLDGTPIK